MFCKPVHRPNRRQGLALPDLLVAAVVFVFLCTLLLPGVLRVRELDMSKRCVNNLKQLSLAFNSWRTVNINTAFRVETWPEALGPYFDNNLETMQCPAHFPAAAAGPMPILGLVATAKSSWDATQTPPARTIDGSGLSGDPAVHGSDFRHMWLSDGTPEQWLSFALGDAYKISHLQIWNYNQKGKSGRGIKRCSIEVSADGTAWTVAVPVTILVEAPGGGEEKAQPITLLGSPTARHVRLNNLTSQGGDIFVGISEVQVHGSVAVSGPISYGMNGYISRTRRVSNTSGTILFLDYGQLVADMGTPANYPSFILPTGVARRHAEPKCVNVGFVDGHVESFSVATIHPSGIVPKQMEMDVGDLYWNNYGRFRSD